MLNLKKYDIMHTTSIVRWEEALPLGNGKMGSLIYGDGPLRVAVDRVDLWDTRPNPTTQSKEFNFQNLVKLAKSGKREDWEKYLTLFDDIFYGKVYPTKLTAGRLTLDFGVQTKNIQSKLSIKNAVANILINDGETGRIETFISANETVGVIKVVGEYSLDIQIPEYLFGKENGSAQSLCYPCAKVVKQDGFTYYLQKTHTEYCFGIVALEKKGAEDNFIYYTLVTGNGEEIIKNARAHLERVALQGYDELKRKHIAWWKNYWKKSQITIPDELLEKTYYRSWYLFASCSRKGGYPMPLQGVWTADNDKLPPWKGDYHHDTNTELSYQSYLKANRLDEGKVFIDYLWSLRGEYQRFAKDFFGVKGLLLPSCSTIDGKAMGGWAQYSLSPTMTIWAAQSFDEYYLYTGDETFLKERAYPFFKGVGEAIYGLLEEKNGKLYLPLSSSPEIYDNEPKAYLTPNSNFDLALLRYLYKTLAGYEKKLGLKERSKNILEKLDEIALDNSMVMLDKTRHLEQTHRHFSHLMCLYPLHLINYDTEENKKIYADSIFELERLGTGKWVGFSFAMMAQIYAMAEMGNSAREKLYQFANGFVAENGFHLNGDFKNYGYTTFHYRPFTLEGLFGYCDALQEMLLQEHQGYIHLFPAIPDEWKNQKISFRDLRSYGGVLVSATMENGICQSVTLKSKKRITISLKNVFGKERIAFSNGAVIDCPIGEIFQIECEGKLTYKRGNV